MLLSLSAASKIRGAVAGIPFEQFHKYSSEIIRVGVFGKGEDGKVREELAFAANNLVSGMVCGCVGMVWECGGGGMVCGCVGMVWECGGGGMNVGV